MTFLPDGTLLVTEKSGTLFDSSGRLWTHEMGPRHGDEFNLTVAGSNYGWLVFPDIRFCFAGRQRTVAGLSIFHNDNAAVCFSGFSTGGSPGPGNPGR